MSSSAPSNRFRQLLGASIQRQSNLAIRKVPKQSAVYVCGEIDDKLYLIESGQVKIVVLSETGKECIQAIYATGDIFGELCFQGAERTETAIAMISTLVKPIRCSAFLAALNQNGLASEFIKYLTARLSQQQEIIKNFVTTGSEQRLAATLLQLARRLGKKDPHATRILQRISMEELSGIVGTTRSRIGYFLKRFRELGLLEITRGSSLIVKEELLVDYLETSTKRASSLARKGPKVVVYQHDVSQTGEHFAL